MVLGSIWFGWKMESLEGVKQKNLAWHRWFRFFFQSWHFTFFWRLQDFKILVVSRYPSSHIHCGYWSSVIGFKISGPGSFVPQPLLGRMCSFSYSGLYSFFYLGLITSLYAVLVRNDCINMVLWIEKYLWNP